ncbi:sugar phosphate isomerase/epimerase family protein [Mucilaginibacter gotjawali]|uniref:Inosose dehydratase n=2 Tax=Mucilaginibacter gotjawali TaxID=1550579 RepID=A0A120MYH6_9SPHI|nr:sugar phosphate isomerase/epimerase [Mucilaginibacter gotjawali]MBB3056416.1 sugar phosphate isomerase/epimerase [Mucilaginibacter gotjawali]BAU55122.1 Inosose dehydratase [Mucilaginibacter gotjawali]
MNNQTRRKFLTQAGIVTAAAMIAPDLLSAKSGHVAGLQLYSLRDQLPKDVKGYIAKVARAGYKEVEPFGYSKKDGFWGLDAKAFSTLLKQNGLTTASAHFGMDQYFVEGKTDDLETYIEAANITGMTYVIIPSINGEVLKSADQFKQVAEKMNKAAELCKKAGLKLGYHNHNFEWKPVDGTTFYDVVLKETDPALVHMEMDIYWVVRAGQDPIKLFQQHPGRFALCHLKDMDKTNHNLNTEIGTGAIDFKKILSYKKLAGLKHFIVEQENFTNIDPIVSISKSAAYVKNVLGV